MSKSSFWKKEFLGIARSVHVLMAVLGIFSSLLISYIGNDGWTMSGFALSWSAYFAGFYLVLGVLHALGKNKKNSSE